MNKQICILILMLTCRICDAQNLVTNPSFEDTIGGCPFFPGEVYKCLGWSTFGHTPDYYNSCSSDTNVSVPINFMGYQNAATGNAYCGFCNYLYSQTFRENIGSHLTQTLIIGQKYFVSLKVSLADKPYYGCASNKVGVKFSTVSYDTLNLPPLDNVAQVYSDSLVNDNSIWVSIKGNFIADSNYTYIIIGNFFTDSNTLNNCNGVTSQASYLLVDDVCVSTDSLTCYSTVGINEVKNEEELILFPNPFTDKINITKKRNEQLEVSLFDITSRKIFNQSFITSTTINTEQLAKGIYLYEVRNKSGVIKKGKVVKD